MKHFAKRLLRASANEDTRRDWVVEKLRQLAPGGRILDAGAGEQQYRHACVHLQYVSQDFCEYDGSGNQAGLQMGNWNYGAVDIVSDITSIPADSSSFDAILCTEVFEHIPDPLLALAEFHRLLKSGGTLILTAPFASLVHFAPYFYSTGFSSYWYRHHLPRIGFHIEELTANGDWWGVLQQEVLRLPQLAKSSRGVIAQLLSYPVAALMLAYLRIGKLRRQDGLESIAAFGFHCCATKSR